MEGLFRQEGQKIMFYPSDKAIGKNISDLISEMQIISKQSFTHDKRKFQFSMFAQKNTLIYTIKCDQLKWNTPINFRGGSFTIGNPQKFECKDIYMQDIILVAKHNTETGHCVMDITTTEKVTPRLTNIYDYAQVCCNITASNITTPQTLLALLESTPGNSDLCTDEQFQLEMINGLPCIKDVPRWGSMPTQLSPFVYEYVD